MDYETCECYCPLSARAPEGKRLNVDECYYETVPTDLGYVGPKIPRIADTILIIISAIILVVVGFYLGKKKRNK